MAARYLPPAADMDGYACDKAAENKQRRYLAQHGRKVSTFAMESWGRVGEEGEAILDVIAGAASRYDLFRGRYSRGRLTRWRCILDGTLQHGIAKALLAARYGLSVVVQVVPAGDAMR